MAGSLRMLRWASVSKCKIWTNPLSLVLPALLNWAAVGNWAHCYIGMVYVYYLCWLIILGSDDRLRPLVLPKGHRELLKLLWCNKCFKFYLWIETQTQETWFEFLLWQAVVTWLPDCCSQWLPTTPMLPNANLCYQAALDWHKWRKGHSHGGSSLNSCLLELFHTHFDMILLQY